ncbi:TonB-dependent receptor domain-containing protein [Alistipes timonensis]|uniref:TonB-dependent receptor domain-containing protein n=1 Tax=Alistipes timonensis TaxID=1465754 RepID=UPI0027D45DAC|nr:TonB-dependent receptor [Alistipes timonensis]
MPETSYYGGIHSIAKDSVGRIWFSGYDALFMYNGSAFVRMDDLVTSLSPSSYWNYGQVVTDHRGGLYVGTNHGLLRFDYGSRSFESVLDGNIGSVMVNGDGTVWLIRNNDIESFDPERLPELVRYERPPDCSVSSLALICTREYVYAATKGNLYRLNRETGQYTLFTTVGGDGCVIRDVVEYGGSVYVLTLMDGLYECDGDGRAELENNHTTDWTWENVLKFDRTFDKHHIDFTGLFSMQETQYTKASQSGEGFVNDDSSFYRMDGAENKIAIGSEYWKQNMVSGMFRVNYSFNSKYLLTVTGRADSFSAFAENHKWAFFPSAAVAWHLGEENFIKDNASWVDMLKIRFSYGANGNNAISRYMSLDRLYSTNGVKYIWGDGGSASNSAYLPSDGIGNPDLRWETTYTANLGIDFQFFNGRLGGTVDMYLSNTHDLLMSRSIPIMNGYSKVLYNVGQTRSRGIQFQRLGPPECEDPLVDDRQCGKDRRPGIAENTDRRRRRRFPGRGVLDPPEQGEGSAENDRASERRRGDRQQLGHLGLSAQSVADAVGRRRALYDGVRRPGEIVSGRREKGGLHPCAGQGQGAQIDFPQPFLEPDHVRLGAYDHRLPDPCRRAGVRRFPDIVPHRLAVVGHSGKRQGDRDAADAARTPSVYPGDRQFQQQRKAGHRLRSPRRRRPAARAGSRYPEET